MDRKEAVEIVRKNFPDSSFTMLREALETLIPELTEIEDERIKQALLEFFSAGAKNNETTCDIPDSKIVSWLEKQDKKSEWNEEDELNHKQAIYVCHQNGYTAVENWLKSLKPQNKWKPSEEQMQTIHMLMTAASSFPEDKRVLTALYEDLLKL